MGGTQRVSGWKPIRTAASVVGGDLCTDEECLEARLFAHGEIPWGQLAFQSTHDALREYLGGRLFQF